MIERDEVSTIGREAPQIAIGNFNIEYGVVWRDRQIDPFDEIAYDLLAPIRHVVEFVHYIERAAVCAELAAH